MAKIITVGRMIKFSHSIFALPFALIGLFLAAQSIGQKFPPFGLVLLWLACMVAARSAAMAFNRIVDHKFDIRNPRTANRELPAGKLTPEFAKRFLFCCAAIFVVATGMFWAMYKNPWPMVFALPLLLFICGYSYAKRFTVLSHFWLGASLGLAPVASWVAVSPPAGSVIGWPVVILGLAVTLWTAGFDIIYSLADIDFDRKTGLRSIPAKLGQEGALKVSRVCHLGTVIFLAMLMLVLGKLYIVGLILAAVILAYEHVLIDRDLKYLNASFFTLNGVFSILFALFAIIDILRMGTL
ncbi:MAG: 4-hydroxybenzoate octaprenyltransferase [Sedimentisphaerales bacterium]|nr:4-hydroxybenzoate octaprenyltransferase [Sedimentisphaerales bacterium]